MSGQTIVGGFVINAGRTYYTCRGVLCVLGTFCKFVQSTNCAVHFMNSQRFKVRVRVRLCVGAKVRIRDRVSATQL